MCGLCGIVSSSDIDTKSKEAFEILLDIGRYRGRDATGVSTYSRRTGEVVLGKCGGTPDFLWKRYPQLLDNKKNTIKQNDLNWIMGHNRKATRGKLCEKNSHPFNCGSLVGSHNGSLPFHQENSLKSILREKGKLDDVKGDTDSELLFMTLSTGASLKEIVEDRNVSGAMALTWWDTEPVFYLYRNSERPLATMISKDGRTLVYSSELKFLKFAREYVKTLDASFNDPEIFPVNKLRKINFSGSTLAIEEEEVKGKTTHVHVYGGHSYGGYEQREWYGSDVHYQHHNKNRNSHFKRKKEEKSRVLPDKTEGKMSIDSFYSLSMHECNCQRLVSYSDYKNNDLFFDRQKKVFYCNRKGCQDG